MTDTPEKPKIKTARDKAKLMLDMTKEAEHVERRLGVDACIVICMFKQEDGQLAIQDAGKFPMPPGDLYRIMIQAHEQGLMGNKPKKSRILKPN